MLEDKIYFLINKMKSR